MIIGVPKEVKNRENRVGLLPAGVRALCSHGHNVYVEKGAGLGAGASDETYVQAGAELVSLADDLWNRSDMVIKVKEPIGEEFHRLRPGLLLYAYLHLAAEPKLTEVLLKTRVSSVAYETVQLEDGSLPLLKPMSEVAGRMATQVGAQCLEKHNGGKGILLGGVPGVKRGRVLILGGGVSGTGAAKMALGLGAQVTILDIHQERLWQLNDLFGGNVQTLMSSQDAIAQAVKDSDLVISTVLVAGARAPVLVTEAMVRSMEPGSAIVDLSIDQGGSVETIRPTTHEIPTFVTHGVVHYAVTNMPGGVPRTSTYALTNATLPYALELADHGLEKALRANPFLRAGLNTHGGKLVCEPVGNALGLDFVPYVA